MVERKDIAVLDGVVALVVSWNSIRRPKILPNIYRLGNKAIHLTKYLFGGAGVYEMLRVS